MIFSMSLLFVFLILAAQYESWSLPFSVLLGTPIAVFGEFLFLRMRGLENNVYAQIGLVMLIGLAAKNAILIVEFAKMEFDKGKSAEEAALTAAKLRLRPILMTAFAFILGCVPLWTGVWGGRNFATGLGTAVIGGMLAASVLAIFVIPVSFDVVERTGPSGKKHLPTEHSCFAVGGRLVMSGRRLPDSIRISDVDRMHAGSQIQASPRHSSGRLPWTCARCQSANCCISRG